MGKYWDKNPGPNKRGKDGLTPKQSLFCKLTAKTGDHIAAAREAYPMASEKDQQVIASINMTKPEIVSSIKDIANREGLTREKCSNKIVDALEAENVSYDAFGREHKVKDHRTRLKAAELGLRIHGELKNDVNVNTVNVVGQEAFKALVAEFWASKPNVIPP